VKDTKNDLQQKEEDYCHFTTGRKKEETKRKGPVHRKGKKGEGVEGNGSRERRSSWFKNRRFLSGRWKKRGGGLPCGLKDKRSKKGKQQFEPGPRATSSQFGTKRPTVPPPTLRGQRGGRKGEKPNQRGPGNGFSQTGRGKCVEV